MPAVHLDIPVQLNRYGYAAGLAEALFLGHLTSAGRDSIFYTMGTSDLDETELFHVKQRLLGVGEDTKWHFSQTCIARIVDRVQNNKQQAFLKIVSVLSNQNIRLRVHGDPMLLCAETFSEHYDTVHAQWKQPEANADQDGCVVFIVSKMQRYVSSAMHECVLWTHPYVTIRLLHCILVNMNPSFTAVQAKKDTAACRGVDFVLTAFVLLCYEKLLEHHTFDMDSLKHLSGMMLNTTGRVFQNMLDICLHMSSSRSLWMQEHQASTIAIAAKITQVWDVAFFPTASLWHPLCLDVPWVSFGIRDKEISLQIDLTHMHLIGSPLARVYRLWLFGAQSVCKRGRNVYQTMLQVASTKMPEGFSNVMPAGSSASSSSASSSMTFLGFLLYQLYNIMALEQRYSTTMMTAQCKRHLNRGHLQIVSQQVHLICCLLFPYFSINKPVDYVRLDDTGDGVSCKVFRKQIKAIIKQDVGPMAAEIATNLKTVTQCIESLGVGRSVAAFSALHNDENVDMLRLLTEYLEQVIA